MAEQMQPEQSYTARELVVDRGELAALELVALAQASRIGRVGFRVVAAGKVWLVTAEPVESSCS
jgi:hypothetical protein